MRGARVLSSCVALASCVDVADPGRDPSGGLASGVSVGDEAADDPGESSFDDDEGDDDPTRLDLGATADVPATCGQDVDIVFVMDVTGSMGEFIETLVADLHTVDAAVQALELPTEPRYGLVVFADDFAVLNDGQPYADLASLEAEFATWIAFTQQDGQIGGGGELNESFPENSLDALVAATTFAWRPAETTTRVVIHTTDDTFWNGPGVFNGEMVEHGYADTVAALQAESIRVFAFAAEEGGECECEDTSPGWFAPFEGQASIPDGTDGGVFDIVEVLEGALSLGAAIPEAVAGSVCEPYEPAG